MHVSTPYRYRKNEPSQRLKQQLEARDEPVLAPYPPPRQLKGTSTSRCFSALQGSIAHATNLSVPQNLITSPKVKTTLPSPSMYSIVLNDIYDSGDFLSEYQRLISISEGC